MSFWIGFACGIAAAWALSLVFLVVITAPDRRRRQRALDELLPPDSTVQPDPAPVAHPDLPGARFTHLTGLGEQVKGRDV
jgi:hypothetical protein